MHLHCRQCVQQPDCSQKDVETSREKLIICIFTSHAPICGLDLGELFSVDGRVKNGLGCVLKLQHLLQVPAEMLRKAVGSHKTPTFTFIRCWDS